MKAKKSGEIKFNEPQLYALWRYEISGQISDGHWENAEPLDHWKFWCSLIPSYDSSLPESQVIIYPDRHRVAKNAYAIVDLSELLSDRMLRLGRLAKSLPNVLSNSSFVQNVLYNSNNQAPNTLAEFLTKFNAKEDVAFSLVQAVSYYTAEYTRKDLRKDLRKISRLMKTVKLDENCET